MTAMGTESTLKARQSVSSESILKAQRDAQEFMMKLFQETIASSGQAIYAHMVDLTRAFQLQNGLKVDGKPGPITLARVREVLASNIGEVSTVPPPPAPTDESLPNMALKPEEWLRGIDIDHYQTIVGPLDASAVQFAYVGVSEGTGGRNSQDPKFRDHLAKLTSMRAGPIGIYHFARPSSARLHGPSFGQPLGEAENFVRQWEVAEKIAERLLPPVLDMEDEREQLNSDELIVWTLKWCEHCERLTGRRPIIYTYFNFIQAQLKGYLGALTNYPLWLADYRPQSYPRDVAGWPWLFWQFTGTGTVRGINGPCDQNLFRGTQAQLEGLLL